MAKNIETPLGTAVIEPVEGREVLLRNRDNAAAMVDFLEGMKPGTQARIICDAADDPEADAKARSAAVRNCLRNHMPEKKRKFSIQTSGNPVSIIIKRFR